VIKRHPSRCFQIPEKKSAWRTCWERPWCFISSPERILPV